MCTSASRDPDQSIAVSVLPLSANSGSDSAAARSEEVAAVIGVGQRVEQVARGFRGFQRAKRVNHGFACRVAAGTPAVGDGEQPGSCVGGVLVAVALAADVGGGGVADGELGSWHGGLPF